MGGRAGAHPSQGEHRVSRVRLYSRGTSSTSSMGGLAADTELSGCRVDELVLLPPPGQAPSLSGTSGPRERRAPARWAALQQTPCSPAVRLDELVRFLPAH